jgi:hypothetical protein
MSSMLIAFRYSLQNSSKALSVTNVSTSFNHQFAVYRR